jgi:ketosteroid isomerase-like protein
MRTATTRIVAPIAVALTCFAPSVSRAAPNDEAAIRTLEDRFVSAVNSGNVDSVMKVYVPGNSLVVFDVVPPRQYVGADAYRKDWIEFFGMFQGGRPKLTISDISVTANGDLGFGRSIQRITGTDPKGQPVDLTVRVTDGYRKINGKWLIVLEHVSVPVDLTTGRPDLSSKP